MLDFQHENRVFFAQNGQKFGGTLKNVYLCIVVQRNRRAPKAGQKIFLGGGKRKIPRERRPEAPKTAKERKHYV